MERQDLAECVGREWQELEAGILSLFHDQWMDPELPCMEYRSAQRLCEFLERHGFGVERGAGGLPTAFTARAGTGSGPVIAFLAEYDALPGLDNEASASRRSLGKAAGHGCGHNHIGPANVAAAIAAARACAALGIAGEIRVVGCPAEEILWGKIALLKAGVFSGIDAVLTSHGDYQTGALSRPCQSVVSGEFVFSGEAGHGGKSGHRNALLVAEDVVSAAGSLLEKGHPGVLLRHVLRQGGVMPSITPAEARVWFTTRSQDHGKARQAYEAISATAAEIASRVGAGLRHQFISESRGYLPNDTLGRLLYRAMQEIGPPGWSASDLAFMEELSRACAPDEEMDLDRGVGYFDTGEDYYGQDDGEVSWRIPLGRVNWAYPKQVPIHHWAWTALSGHAAGHKGPLAASQTLALAAVRLLASPGLIGAAKDERARRVAGIALTEPRLGAFETLTRDPACFWSATWRE
ncbi:amidohydrolase [Aestuariivirga sp.]|uniref:amidohydrolase n=1 Tax=Aestuariivirga sp. TaxID=2650926 RepID=UPI003919E60C